ncbi:MAG: ribonuclease E/G [Hyphomonadaceae bacterium]
MSDEIWIDGAIGETRQALVRGGRVIALRLLRASEEGARARWGEVYAARVLHVDRRRRGAFLDLGLKHDQGFLPLDPDGQGRLGRQRVALKEGQGVVVSIAREAARAKNPVVALTLDAHPGGASARLARHESDEALDGASPASAAVRARIDEAMEEALSAQAPIPGGGALTIEPTAALVAIDVDAGARAGEGDPEKFALSLNIAAAGEAARQVRLRSLGGLLALDFVSMRRAQSRALLEAAVKAAFAGDPWGVLLAPISRFGVIEAARAQLQAPLHERLCDGDGRLSAETIALQALRAIEREARAQPSRRIAAQVTPEIMAWLEAAPIAWRAALANRIGPRFAVEAVPAPAGARAAMRERIDVRAL